ncbi:MAG TPA: CocE/NonD family hydrolase [Solirubrobacteraceae bacterium]|nr:CocE/NonD family hydrolase [Solirubrobacteraceae bacterium]
MPEVAQRRPVAPPQAAGRSAPGPLAGAPSRRDLLGRREVLVFRLALLVVAIGVLDDAFAHREPGTSAADHLLSGLLPVAVAAALALAYPHLRAGLRAIAAISCGVLAAVAGVADGVRHVAVDGLAGDDVTAMLAGLAGLLLLALGAVTLWRSRRLDERRARRYARRALLAAAGLLGAFFVLLPIAFAIIATHKARSPVVTADLGRPYAAETLRTADGLRLAAWYVPSRNRAAVIAFPGRRGPVRHARMLARHGYGVLLLDRRGEGESEGDMNLYGWNGEGDLDAAVAFLRRRPDVDRRRIGGLGLSVGGELLLGTAARNRGLRAVVSEGAGVRSLHEHLETPGVGGVQRWGTPWLVETPALASLSNTAPPANLADLVGRIAPRPILLIRALHGNEDEVLNRVYLRRAGPPKALWEVGRGGHTGALEAVPAQYERRVVGFFDRALLGR